MAPEEESLDFLSALRDTNRQLCLQYTDQKRRTKKALGERRRALLETEKKTAECSALVGNIRRVQNIHPQLTGIDPKEELGKLETRRDEIDSLLGQEKEMTAVCKTLSARLTEKKEKLKTLENELNKIKTIIEDSHTGNKI
ncbi:MAG: uncharacterized protein A8A55_1058 [Amphiamblys sp. WSBS2006]|nr:MAG: uncharacterized protein A8A55_1058 [Amphiamblys sp. WSBS2006]